MIFPPTKQCAQRYLERWARVDGRVKGDRAKITYKERSGNVLAIM